MAVTINGSTGIASVDGSAGSPGVRGSDANSGIFYAADTVKISTGGTERLEVDSSGDVHLPVDNEKLMLGAGEDLNLHSDGNNGFIRAPNGNLYLQSDGEVIISDVGGNEYFARFVDNEGVKLYYNHTLVFEIGSTSSTVTYGNSYHESGGIMATYAHTGTGEAVRFRANTSTVVGSITINSSSTTYSTSSDYRLKENQVSISDGITRLKTLKPYRFNFKGYEYTKGDEKVQVEPSETVDGFFAHEVTPAVPEAITGEKDGTEMQGIDQSKLVPLLTAALQESIAKIETLETKIAALEAG